MSTLREMMRSGLRVLRDDHDALDNMNAAYWAEHDRWCSRRKGIGEGFELVRNTSPGNDIVDESYQALIHLSKRECRDRHDAAMWLQTYARRAAMQKALEAIR